MGSERQHVELTREELYDLVWSDPMRDLAKRFHLSDVGLKKICTKHRIPVPGRGHWQKLRAGKNSRRIPLPAVKNAAAIHFSRQPPPVQPDQEQTLPDPALEAEKAFPAVVVAEALSRPHPLTIAMRQDLKGRKPDDYGAIHCIEPESFSARIHPGSTARLLRIVDAIVKGFSRRGFELRPRKRDARTARGLQILVDDEAFSISIEERMRRETHRPTPDELARKRRGQFVYMRSFDYAPTGEFTLKIEPCYAGGIQSSWRDSTRQRLEDRLTEVMVSLRRHAAQRKEERARTQRRAARHEEEQERRAALRTRVDAEREAVAKLEQDAGSWKRAEQIRAFVAAVEKANRLGTAESSSWADWARAYADRIDPLTEAPPSILDTPEAEMTPISLWQFNDDEE